MAGTGVRPRAWWSAVVVVVVGVLLAVVPAAPATPHAVLLGTNPADGQVLTRSPERLTVWFSEPISSVPGAVLLVDDSGDAQRTQVLTADNTVMVEVTDSLADGTYLLSWRVISGDSHPVAGAITFSVGAPSVQPPAADAAPDRDAAVSVSRWVVQVLIYSGVLLAAGLAVFEVLFLTATPGAAALARARLRRVGRAAAVAGAVGAFLMVPLTSAWQSGGNLATVLGTTTWAAPGASEGVVVAVLVALGLAAAALAVPAAAARPRAAAPSALAVGGAGLAVTALVVTGHTRSYGPTALVLTSDAVHLATAATWFGGLVGLVLVLTHGSGLSPSDGAVTLRRFSAAAGFTVLALALTGLLLGWRILGSLNALTGTGYGRVLLVKVGLAALVLLVAAWNRRNLPRLADGTSTGLRLVRRTATTEAALLAAVVLVTATLVSLSPQLPPAAAAPAEAVQEFDLALGDGRLGARVVPAHRGVNVLELSVLDAQGQPLQPVADPTVRLSLPEVGLGPLTAITTAAGPGDYAASIDLPLPGRWEIQVGVRTSTYDNPVVTLTLEIPQ